jgi:hypothetical protein
MTTSRSTWVLGRQPNTAFECAETDSDTRGDCDGPYGVGETATYAYGRQPRQAVELCRSHGQQAVATGQLVRWTEYDVQPHTFEQCSGPCAVHRPPRVLMHYWPMPTAGEANVNFLCSVDQGFRSSNRDSVTCPDCIAALREQRLQLAVTYADDVTRYYPVTGAWGWRIDVTHRQIVIGRGVPRTMIPLDSVRAYTIEQIGGRDG